MQIRALTIAILLALTFIAPTKAQDIIDIASNNDDFETLTAAVKAAGLVDALQGQGPLTVFAPTDKAFSKLPSSVLQALLRPENRDTLTNILTYHVAKGSLSSRAAITAGTTKTLNGKKITFMIDNGRMQAGEATVVASDLEASNGLIHVIDQVLLPPNLDLASLETRPGIIGVHIERPGRALASQLDLDRHESLVITGFGSGRAEEAGLERYDVITRINGRPASSDSLDRAKREEGIGGKVELEVLREGRSMEVQVPVVARH